MYHYLYFLRLCDSRSFQDVYWPTERKEPLKIGRVGSKPVAALGATSLQPDQLEVTLQSVKTEGSSGDGTAATNAR